MPTSPQHTDFDDEPRAQLRPEARPARLEELDERQSAGFDTIVDLLEAAAKAVQNRRNDKQTGVLHRRQAAGPFLDRERTTTTVLVGGDRGAGKTTLLLTVFNELAGESAQKRHERSGFGDDRDRRLFELSQRLVWLETVDMEPLSRSVNLLGAVLARLEDSVGSLMPEVKPEEQARLMSPGIDYHDALTSLRELQNTVAVAFRGSVADRAGTLDLETLAHEARRTEHERLNLNERFVSVFALLSATVASYKPLREPIFVLPVDDLDLNPAACVELLQLLRAVHTPHLFVLLAADLKFLQTVMRLRYRSEIRSVAGGDALRDDELRMADVLASSALRKHIPPHQRVLLTRAQPAETLSFSHRFGANLSKPLPLGQVLGSITLARDRVSLDGEVANPLGLSWLRSLGEPPKADRKRYSWPGVLHMTRRQVVDLDLAARSDRQEGQRALLAIAATQLAELTPDFDLQVESPLVRPRQVVRVDRPTSRPGARHRIRTRGFDGWEVSRGAPSLSRDDCRTYVGALDLLGEDSGRPPYDGGAPVLRQTEVLSDDAEVIALFEWPMLFHSTYWGWERVWWALVDAEEKWAGKVGRYHGAWASVMTGVLVEALQGGSTADELPGYATTWAALRDQLQELPDGPPGVQSGWRVAVGALCTPEMGLVGKLPVSVVVERLADRVRLRRRARLAPYPQVQWPSDLPREPTG